MPRPDQAGSESERQRLAFETYNCLGAGRTYQAVAEKLGVSSRTIRSYAKEHNWQHRVAEREAQVAREIADRAHDEGLANTEENLKIVRLAKLTIARNIKDGKIPGTMADFERLARFERELLGLDDDILNDPNTVVIKHEGWFNDHERVKEFLVNGCIDIYRRYPEARERIRQGMAQHDANPTPMDGEGRPIGPPVLPEIQPPLEAPETA